MPSPTLWPPQKSNLVEAINVNITTDNMDKFFYAFGRPDGYEMYKDTKDLTDKMGAPNVDVYCLHGKGIKTTNK
jgi:hypothetical protein